MLFGLMESLKAQNKAEDAAWFSASSTRTGREQM
jgi:hypothetical protein